MSVIYALKDPRTSAVRYVGFTTIGVEARLRAHLKEVRQGIQNDRCNWLRELVSNNLTPAWEVLEELATWAIWQDRERYWIASFGRATLVNGTIGGEGRFGHTVPASVRRKISEKLKGHKRSAESIRKGAEALRGKKKSEAHIAALRGLRKSPETRARMSATRKGIVYSKETRDKIAASLRARPFDDARSEQLANARSRLDELRAQKKDAADA